MATDQSKEQQRCCSGSTKRAKNSPFCYKGQLVLLRDTVKNDSGSYAVITEQGSSASQMTAAKVMDDHARLPVCAGQAVDEVSAQNGGRSKVVQNSTVRMSRCVDTSSTTSVAKVLVKH